MSDVKPEGTDDRKSGIKRKTDDRPPGRQLAKQQRALEEHRSKKLRMTNEEIALQKRHVEELERHNDINLFTQGPGGAESDMAKQFFAIQQKKRLAAMNTGMEDKGENKGLTISETVVLDGDE